MEHAFLIVPLLLQLCVAEIPKSVPGWYAANLINDSNYSPKPITEIFSTESPLSSDNPVLILQSTQSPITQDIVRTSDTTWSTGTTQTQFPRLGNIPDLPSTIPQTTLTTQGQNQPIGDVSNIIGTLDQLLQPYRSTSLPTIAVTPSTIQTWLPTQSTIPTEYSTLSTSSPLNRETYSTLSPYVPTLPTQGNRPCDLKNHQKLKSNSTPTLLMPLPKPLLTIRLKAPRGSITNLHINPSTTTKKPTTTRRRKSSKRKSDFDACQESCKDKRDPICASPAGITPVESNTLKGFPSLCHMACHNSFRKEITYEKVADGRCGRLRTRIRTIEKNKIKREDLKKAQYTVHTDQDTVVEFSPLER